MPLKRHIYKVKRPKRPKWNFDTETLARTLFEEALMTAVHSGEEVNIEELFKKSWQWAEAHEQLLAVKKRDYAFSNADYNETLDEVRERDKYRCKQCGQDGLIDVHHIIPVSVAPQLACELWNMLVLCQNCHDRIAGKELEYRAQLQRLVDQST